MNKNINIIKYVKSLILKNKKINQQKILKMKHIGKAYKEAILQRN